MPDLNLNYLQILDDFEKIEQNIASILTDNKDLFKLLKFSDYNPLSHHIEDEEIENMITEYDEKEMLNPDCRIFFEPFIDSTLTTKVSHVRIYPSQMNPENVYLADVYIQVDVIVHQSISKIKGGRRRNRILAEIIKSLNGSNIKLAQTLRIVDKPLFIRQFKSDYWGYSVLFTSGIAVK